MKAEEDKNRFCFFWYLDGKLTVFRYRTILFGLVISPFILNYVIKYHLNRYQSDETVDALLNSFYVDNFIFTTSNPELLSKVYSESHCIMNEGGFSLRSWNTNDNDLKLQMQRDDKLVKHDEIFEKVLGYYYNPQTDTLKLANYSFEANDSITKRDVLRYTSKVFDPLSLFLPVTIRGRLLMKSIWETGIDWDKTIPDKEFNIWKDLQTDLIEMKNIEISRQTCDVSSNNPISLHIFMDGSNFCYGFCAYIVSDMGSNLVFAKAKVKDNKRTIPQTELLSMYLSLKCLTSLLESYSAIPFIDINLWTDSQIVLQWVLGTNVDKPKNKFTKNRIIEIKDMIKEIYQNSKLPINLRYIKTDENPADLLTRGMKLKDFQKVIKFWQVGPQWLVDKTLWPSSDLHCLSENVKREVRNYNMTVETIENEIKPVFDITKFSSLKKVYGVTEKIMKFVANSLKRNSDNVYDHAKEYWLKLMQEESFPEEIKFLKNLNKSNTKINEKTNVPKLIKDLNLFLDDNNLLRCQGRIGKCNFYSYEVQNPILLSKSHYLTKLIVEDQHVRCKHMGLGTTLTELREKGYWLPNGRQVVKSIIRPCIICQKMNAVSCNLPKLTNLPRERVQFIKPYDNLAIDYTGHIYVANDQGEKVKVYIVLYTCLALRCVHIDVVPDLTVLSFLHLFKRFCSRFSTPSSIFTDNGHYFEASRPHLSKAFITDDFTQFMRENSIRHRTIPLYASWVGGVYERQIKTMKQCLYKTVGRAQVTYQQLITILTDIEDVINNRPLTYVNSDIHDLEPLTPNRILKVYKSNRLTFFDDFDRNDPMWCPNSDRNNLHESLNKTLSFEQKLFEDYRNIWYRQYLLSLRENNRDVFEVNWNNRLKEGSIVLVETPKPRPYWLLGKITKLLYGNDGKVRSVYLKLGNKDEIHRSLNHIYPLEVQSTHTGDSQFEETNNLDVPPQNLFDLSESCDDKSFHGFSDNESFHGFEDGEVNPMQAKRQKRKAALKSEYRTKNIIEQYNH